MKKYIILFLTACLLVLSLSACGSAGGGSIGGSVGSVGSSGESVGNGGDSYGNGESGSAEVTATKILVAYFSCTNHTKGVAEKIADFTGGELYEILPAEPYSQADLNYNADCRANREQSDPDARPEISGRVQNMADYEVVFLGYPIWWGEAPKIIYTFLESYDFSGKTVVPFCTSGSSEIGSSATNLHSLAVGANWLGGKRFSASASKSEVENWVSGLNVGEGEKR